MLVIAAALVLAASVWLRRGSRAAQNLIRESLNER
jgi:hypothetical protein